MNIGGIDIQIDATLEDCVGVIQKFWENAVVQSPSSEEVTWFVTPEHTEICVYIDVDIEGQWHLHGAIPELANTMIHLLRCSDNSTTVVVDDPVAKGMDLILQELKSIK